MALRSEANTGGDRDEASAGLYSFPWLECLAPLWLLDLLYAGVAGYVAANTIAGRFVMAPTQGLCFALLVSALAGSTIAEMLLTGDHRCGRRRREGRGGASFPTTAYVEVLLGVNTTSSFVWCRVFPYVYFTRLTCLSFVP